MCNEKTGKRQESVTESSNRILEQFLRGDDVKRYAKRLGVRVNNHRLHSS